MRFFGCAGDPACAGEDRVCNHINRIGSQSYRVGLGAVRFSAPSGAQATSR
jgi:hypothetical protein